MAFTVVDIPQGGGRQTNNSPIVQALLDNIGKAIVIPCGDGDANTMRKNIRQALNSRKVLREHIYKTKTDLTDGKNDLIAWLEKIERPVSQSVIE